MIRAHGQGSAVWFAVRWAVAQHVQVRDVLPATGKHSCHGTQDQPRAVEGPLGNELRQAVLTQGTEAGSLDERSQQVQAGVGGPTALPERTGKHGWA